MKKTFFAMMAVAGAFSAFAGQIELLKNGEGTTLDGWQSNYGVEDGFSAEDTNGDGVFWFKSSHQECRIEQTIDLAAQGISAETSPTVIVSGLVQAYRGSRICRVVVEELDRHSNILEKHTIINWGGRTIGETAFSESFELNPDTVKLCYQLQGQDKDVWKGHFGPCFRNCSLTVFREVLVNFVSEGESLGTVDFESAPVAAKKGDYRFLGYFTEETGGDQIIDENYKCMVDGSTLVSLAGKTLYAHWAPVVRKLDGGVTRLVYRGVLSNFGEWTSGLKKNMRVKIYDSASAATPLWSGDAPDVAINPDGSFEAVFGNDELALAFASNNLTHVELTVGDALSALAPRRRLASVASVNRALVAEGAASDIKVGTLGANALVAESVTAGSLEASGTVRVEGNVSVEVKPFSIERGRETTILRGAGVTAWGDPECVATVNKVVAGQLLWTANREGVAMIHCSGSNRSTLRIPATIQFVRPGDKVRAPTWDDGEVSVTVWGYRK